MSWKCEFWDPEHADEHNGRSCSLSNNDECPYPDGCYQDDDDQEDEIGRSFEEQRAEQDSEQDYQED